MRWRAHVGNVKLDHGQGSAKLSKHDPETTPEAGFFTDSWLF